MLVEFRSPEGHPTRKVLIVDDEKDIRDGLALFLRSAMPGLEVVVASSGDAAVPLLDDVDLVVSDLRMPGMSGLELLQIVRKRHPDAHRILITAFDPTNLAHDGTFEALLRKPFSLATFQATVVGALSGASAAAN